MQRMMMTRSWAQIHQMYLKYASLGYGQFTTEIHEMLQLVERIEGSRHAEHLHAWMSCLDLNIIQVPSEYPYDGPRLTICPLWTGKLVFHFLPDVRPIVGDWSALPRRGTAFHELRSRLQNTVEEGRWQLECDAREGFATLEECLYRMEWIRREDA